MSFRVCENCQVTAPRDEGIQQSCLTGKSGWTGLDWKSRRGSTDCWEEQRIPIADLAEARAGPKTRASTRCEKGKQATEKARSSETTFWSDTVCDLSGVTWNPGVGVEATSTHSEPRTKTFQSQIIVVWQYFYPHNLYMNQFYSCLKQHYLICLVFWFYLFFWFWFHTNGRFPRHLIKSISNLIPSKASKLDFNLLVSPLNSILILSLYCIYVIQSRL